MDNFLAGLGAVFFSVYLAYDTKLIVGGTHQKRQFGKNDYILAALSIYQDMIGLFIRIMKLLGTSKNKNKRRR
jgi:FtsH-binding integral membrane protein